MEKYFIYVSIDPESSQIRYVGKTKKPNDRFKRHLSLYSLQESWTEKNKWILSLKKRGLTPLMQIIDEGNNISINGLEKKWISFYKDIGEKLTNMTEGGDGFDWTGRRHSTESINRMRANHPFRREVLQLNLSNKIIKIFNSIHECSDELGIRRRDISDCCRGKKLVTKNNFYFRFIDDYFPCEKSEELVDMNYIRNEIDIFNSTKIEHLTKKELISMKISNKNSKQVVQYDLEGNIIGEFKSMTDANIKTGCSLTLISKCCLSKKYYTVNGTTFRMKSDPFDYVPYNKSIQVSSKRICKYDLSGKLICIYDSVKQAVRENLISSDSNIISCCRRKVNKKTGKFIIVKGNTYRYFEETLGDDLIEEKKIP